MRGGPGDSRFELKALLPLVLHGRPRGGGRIDNACGASPATPSAQSTKNVDFEGSEFLQAASGGLGGPLLRPLGDLSGASWGPRRRKNHPENANWPKETPKSCARVPGEPPTVRKGPQETSQRASEAKIAKTSKMTTLSSENLDFGGPKGQKLKENW